MATERERDVSNDEAFAAWEASGFPGLKLTPEGSDEADEDAVSPIG